MSESSEREKSIQKSMSRRELVMLIFPFWLLVFWFRADISCFFADRLFSLPPDSIVSGTVIFFLSTLLKVFLLLILIIFVMVFLRTWVPLTKIRKVLTRMHPIIANCLAGLFGVISPFCSCSAIPLFISFLESGVPLGITFSFLIASPLVNEIILIMLFSLFGWKIAVIYMIAGLIIAVAAGFVIDLLRLEKYLPSWILNFRNSNWQEFESLTLEDRVSSAISSVGEVLSRTWIFIIAGILIGSVIHGYVPDSYLSDIAGKDKWFSLPLMVLTGIPLYSCPAAVVPVAFSLVGKGVPLGTALAFMMAVTGLSLPEFIMLKKVLSLRLILIFASIVFAGILLMGYFFNLVL